MHASNVNKKKLDIGTEKKIGGLYDQPMELKNRWMKNLKKKENSNAFSCLACASVSQGNQPQYETMM